MTTRPTTTPDGAAAAPHPAILAVATASPPRRYTQREIHGALARVREEYRHPRVEEIFLNGGIEARRLFVDLDEFRGDESIGEMQSRFIGGATVLGTRAIRSALFRAGTTPDEIDFIAAATCTGYLCPGLSAIYAREVGFPDRIERADLVGMGCAGALPALQRAADYVRAHPGTKALAVAVEVCSACYYFDGSLETIIGNAICGDGAAAVVLGSDAGARPEGRRDRDGSGPLPAITGFRSVIDTSLIDAVGFRNIEGRLRIVLAPEVRDLAGGLARTLTDRLLSCHGVPAGDIRHWILHPGGRRVLDAVQAELGLDRERVRHSEAVLREYGNMSSPTVLFVLHELLAGTGDADRPQPGDIGVMIALGPGLAAEGAFLRW